jgi:hypothetical protein
VSIVVVLVLLGPPLSVALLQHDLEVAPRFVLLVLRCGLAHGSMVCGRVHAYKLLVQLARGRESGGRAYYRPTLR